MPRHTVASNARPEVLGTDPGMTRRNDAAGTRQAYLERLVRKAPPLSQAQRAKLGALLAPVAVPIPARKGKAAA